MTRCLLSKVCNSLVITMLSSIPCLGTEKVKPKKQFDYEKLITQKFVNLSLEEQVALRKYYQELASWPALALDPIALAALQEHQRAERQAAANAAAPYPIYAAPSSGRKKNGPQQNHRFHMLPLYDENADV
jgi:hypothetical protein